jgi:putative transposase
MKMTVTEGQDQLGSSFGSPSQEPGSARSAGNEMVDAGLFDDLMSRIDEGTLKRREGAGCQRGREGAR